jgi:predicted dithiol-disulfide oxidoreductase (DUF899 family)
MTDTTTPLPPVVDRDTWTAQVNELRVRETAHTREGDAIAATRRRMPMVVVSTARSRSATPASCTTSGWAAPSMGPA